MTDIPCHSKKSCGKNIISQATGRSKLRPFFRRYVFMRNLPITITVLIVAFFAKEVLAEEIRKNPPLEELLISHQDYDLLKAELSGNSFNDLRYVYIYTKWGVCGAGLAGELDACGGVAFKKHCVPEALAIKYGIKKSSLKNAVSCNNK